MKLELTPEIIYGACTIVGAFLGYLARYIFQSITGNVKTQGKRIQEIQISLARIETKIECLPKMKADIDATWVEIRKLKPSRS